MTLLATMPPFPTGELVSSFLPRALRYTRSVSVAEAYRMLLDSLRGGDTMPRRMQVFHEILGHNYGDLQSLMSDHTHINLYLLGLPPHKHEAQYERLRGNLPGPNRLVKLPSLCSETERAWKQCPACIEDQLESGFTFVQRELAFVGLAVCPIHGERLRSSGGQMDLFDKETSKQLTKEQARNNQELGARAAHCMATPPELSGYQTTDVILRLENAGWIQNGRLHLADLTDEFIRLFGGSMGNAILDCLFSNRKYIEAALRSLLRPERGIHPLWCIQFVWFSELRQRQAPPAKVVPEATRRRTATPTAAEIERQIALHGSMTATAKAMDINLKRLCSLATGYGIRYSARPKIVDEAMHVEIMRAYDRKVTPQVIAAQFGISLSTAYAQLTTYQGKFSPRHEQMEVRTEKSKTRWSQFRAEYPEKSTTALRHLIPATWRQLESKAPAWLKEHSPERCFPRALNRQPLDPMLRKLLLTAWDRCTAVFTAPGVKPTRTSGYRLLDATGVKEPILRGRHAPPELHDVIEKHKNFVRRRLLWAFPDGYPEGARLWRIAKSCGVRESSIRKVFGAANGSDNTNKK